MVLSLAEENYLKCIYHLSNGGVQLVSTNAIAEKMKTRPASVSDMIRKLAEKNLLSYEKYMGVNLSESGKRRALMIVRKHRLWEVFLVDKLQFHWDEVHEVAEQLEHIQSEVLIRRLDAYLGHPKYDPHGDPIPDMDGEFKEKPAHCMADVNEGSVGILSSLRDSSAPFLQYLDKVGLTLGTKVKVRERISYDQSLELVVDNHRNITISKDVAENLMITL